MHDAVVLSFLLQLLLCAQMHLCQKPVMTTKAAEKKVVTTKALKPVVERGSFAQPNCCSAPWTFNGATGQCILDMEAQGVKDKDMDPLCTAVGFELQEKTCIRYVRLLYKYETN